MPLRMEPGQVYKTWADFKQALQAHCEENTCLFNISNAKTVEQANRSLKKKPFFDVKLKYASCILVCKHYGSYTSLSTGLRPKQKTYKTNCKAYINVSACRKENYLIIRDSCHLHTHPCTEELYCSYPEVRRMTKDEKKIVGTLMELGVPTSQIKTAVSEHVTPKDLQNAKTHLKAMKMGLKTDDSEISPKRHQITADSECTTLPELDDQAVLSKEPSSSSSQEERILKEVVSSVDSGDSGSYIVTVAGLQESLGVGASGTDSFAAEDTGADKEETAEIDAGGLSGLLAAAGINSDSVVVTMNSHPDVKEDEANNAENTSAYTVTVCLPGGDVSKKGNNLQELLKGLPLGKIISKPSSSVTSPMKAKPEEDDDQTGVVSLSENHKLCIQCQGYVSPLDGHDCCLSCLGPEHIQEESCPHCRAMTPEQFNIRRKKMVALRMKALKALQQKRRLEEEQQRQNHNSDEVHDSDSDYTSSVQRKSKRIRKPKSFGPDISMESYKRKRRDSPAKTEHSNLRSLGTEIKSEPLYEEENIFLTSGSQDHSKDMPGNSERFEHILSQTSVFDDVVTQHTNGLMTFTPEQEVSNEFHRLMVRPDLPAVPPTLKNKYRLDSNFESEFCSLPEPLKESLELAEPSLDAMNKGLCKLATNAAANTRLAVYDKLFTRLGMGMADEALSILTELYGKVTQVTEISQEDLTSNLQTAVDTIQALKDVLEELGIMSKDAALTAAYQRSISLNSLSKAKASLKTKKILRDTNSPRRGKFIPFAIKKLCSQVQAVEPSPEPAALSHEIPLAPQEEMEVASTTVASSVPCLVSSHSEPGSSAEISAINVAGPQASVEVSTEPEPTFINMAGKLYSVPVPPMTISSELLQTLGSSKESIIENVGW